MMNLGDFVTARTGDGKQEGRIVGRSVSACRLYDVRTATEILVNVPEKCVQLMASTATSTPPAAPKINVSQPREIYRATAEITKQVAVCSQDRR
jgi:hypothetical protein